MNYFEITERLMVLKKFLKLYMEYISFTNRPENVAADIVRKKMRPLVPMTLDCLRKVHVGTIVTRDAPSRGGKRVKINIIKAIFRDSLVQHFRLEDDAPIEALEAAIVKFKVERNRARLQLFNPLFWLMQVIRYLTEVPFILLRIIGFETDDFEKSSAGKFIKFVIVLFILLLIGKASGLMGWLTTFAGISGI